MTKDSIVPGVFLFKWLPTIDYSGLKLFMNENGVESSVFYGQDAFFVPCHDELNSDEIDYICELLKYYYKARCNGFF